MRKWIFLWVAVLLVYSGHTQMNIQGQVLTETGKPLSGVTIALVHVHKKNIIAFTITNDTGLFILQFNKPIEPDSLQIKVSASGYGSLSTGMQSLPEKIIFRLVPASIQLPEVIVKAGKPAIRYKADTLTYAVDSFVQRQDRTIGDVLRRLPGIEVDRNGRISFNGQPISHFYIDGDDVLADKYNIATNSVGADMVKDVQVLENHQPVRVLNNVAFSDKVALNLNLKSKARLKLTARIETGGGYADKGIYDANANLMVFKKKYKSIHSLKANNSGVDIARDVLSHNLNDILKNIQNHIPAEMLNLNYPRNPSLEQQRMLFNTSALVNANQLIKTPKDIQLRFNIHQLSDKQAQSYLSNTYFYLPANDTVAYLQQQETVSRISSSQFKFTATSNKSRFYYNHSTTAEFSRQPAHSVTTLNQQISDQRLLQRATNLSNEFNGLVATPSKNILEIYSYFNYLQKPERLTVLPGIVPAIFNAGMPYKTLQQEVTIPSFFTHQSLTYRRPSKKFLQTYKTGFTRQWQKMKSAVSVLQLNNELNTISDSFMNQIQWRHQQIYFDADYDYLGTRVKVTLSIPVSFQHIRYTRASGANRLYDLNQLVSSPSISLKYSTGLESYLLANYRFGNDIGSLQDVYDGFVVQNFNRLTRNSIPSSITSLHSANLTFNYRKSIKLFFLSTSAKYSSGRNNNIGNAQFGSQLQLIEVIPYLQRTRNLSLSASLSKYLFPLKTTVLIKSSIQQNEWDQMQNGIAARFVNSTSNFSVTITPKVSQKINVSYSGNYINSFSKPKEQKTVLQSVSQMWHTTELSFFPSANWQLKIRGEDYFIRQQQTGQSDNFFFADLSVLYKMDKMKTDISLEILNLANVRQYKMNTVSANSLHQTAVLLRPRMVLLKALFNL